MNQKELGKAFRNIRTNRNISMKQVADEHVSVSLLSRFERGESDISLSKFMQALSNMHVEMNEYMSELNGKKRSDTIAFMRQLTPLEYKRDAEGFRQLEKVQKELFEKNPSVYQYHLNQILARSFVCKITGEEFPKEYLDEVSDYLFTVESWNIYELILIGNLYLFIDMPQLHRMGQEIVHRRDSISANQGLLEITLLNIFETCIDRGALKEAEYYKDAILPLLEDETLLYERNIYHFLLGLYHYKSGNCELGKEEMEQSIRIYEWLGCKNLRKNYTDDYKRKIY